MSNLIEGTAPILERLCLLYFIWINIFFSFQKFIIDQASHFMSPIVSGMGKSVWVPYIKARLIPNQLSRYWYLFDMDLMVFCYQQYSWHWWTHMPPNYSATSATHNHHHLTICYRNSTAWRLLFSVQSSIDCFTVSLHSPNGRHLPAVRAVQGDC